MQSGEVVAAIAQVRLAVDTMLRQAGTLAAGAPLGDGYGAAMTALSQHRGAAAVEALTALRRELDRLEQAVRH